MVEDKVVTVYNYVEFEPPVDSPTFSGFKASKAVIERLGGKVLEGTGQEVPVSELDAQGRWRRIATGWGELSE